MSSKFLISAESSCPRFSTAARCSFNVLRSGPDGGGGAAGSAGVRGVLEKSPATPLLFDDDSPRSEAVGSSLVCGRKPPLLTGGEEGVLDLAAGAAVGDPPDFGTELEPKAS